MKRSPHAAHGGGEAIQPVYATRYAKESIQDYPGLLYRREDARHRRRALVTGATQVVRAAHVPARSMPRCEHAAYAMALRWRERSRH